MKKTVILIFLLVIFPTINAVEIKLSKDSYFPSETMLVEVTGNFLKLSLENFYIYKKGIPRPYPVVSGFTRQENVNYYYAILPKEQGNYSLKIEKSEYSELGDKKSEALEKDFTIFKSNYSAISINPGFVIAKDNFIVKIKSLNKNINVFAKLEGSLVTKNLSLIEDVETKLSFSVKNISSKKIYLLISDYKIPVFILNDITPDDKPSGIQELTFIPSTLSDNVIPGKNYLFKVTLQNTVSNLSIENIEIKDDLDLNITPRKISRINGLDYVILEISVAVNKDLKQNISGKISASYNNKEIILPLDFMLTKNKSEELLSNNSITNDLSCSSIGVLCKENEVCSGKTTKSLQGPCCIGSCIMQKQANVSKYIGLAIILGILAVLVYFYLRSKKIKPKSPQQILKEKSEEYRQKINPNSKEVSRSLEKV